MLSRAWQTGRSTKTGPHGTHTASRFAASAARTPPRGGHRHTRSLGRPRSATPADLRRYTRCGRAARCTRESDIESQTIRNCPGLLHSTRRRGHSDGSSSRISRKDSPSLNGPADWPGHAFSMPGRMCQPSPRSGVSIACRAARACHVRAVRCGRTSPDRFRFSTPSLPPDRSPGRRPTPPLRNRSRCRRAASACRRRGARCASAR
jgi:hypothetical protein